MASSKKKIEFGDFQTPTVLASEVCSLVSSMEFLPRSILEPTCGKGSFIGAALKAFPGVSKACGFDINHDYIHQAKRDTTGFSSEVHIKQADFFLTNWDKVVSSLPDPLLIIGNPPWVTNSVLGSLGSGNLPVKSNVENLRGIDALMGKSNFDISEWMLRQYTDWLNNKNGLMAILCKTSVARKVLRDAWDTSKSVSSASVYRIDSKKHFNVAVDACVLIMRFSPGASSKECSEFESLDATSPSRVFGLRDDRLIANVTSYSQNSYLIADGLSGWRSGIKHDCSRIFELTRQEEGVYLNGLGESIELEQTVVYPLLKSSDLARNRKPRKWLLVPHESMNADVGLLQKKAPQAWEYLEAHSKFLEKRGSSIYRKRHPFSIFGVGAYSFAPWKIAISGLYKELTFVKVSEYEKRPVVFDDTCYSFPCRSQEECDILFELLSSKAARDFLLAFIFWDAKRPITAQILNQLDLSLLAEALGKKTKITERLSQRQTARYTKHEGQQLLFT